MLAKALVNLEKTADAQSRKQKRNGETGRIKCEKKNTLPDGIFCRSDCKHAGENRSDARSPAKSKREAHQESAHDSGLISANIAQVHVAIQPAREARADQEDESDRVEIDGSQMVLRRVRPHAHRKADNYQDRADCNPSLNADLRQSAHKMKAEQDDQGARNRRQ